MSVSFLIYLYLSYLIYLFFHPLWTLVFAVFLAIFRCNSINFSLVNIHFLLQELSIEHTPKDWQVSRTDSKEGFMNIFFRGVHCPCMYHSQGPGARVRFRYAVFIRGKGHLWPNGQFCEILIRVRLSRNTLLNINHKTPNIYLLYFQWCELF